MDVAKLLATSAEAGFACDCLGTIVAWNAAAEKLLNHKSGDVIGRRCYDVVRGKDLFGNRFCSSHCALRTMAGENEPIRRCQVVVQSASDDLIRAWVSVMILVGESRSDTLMVHLLSRANGDPVIRGCGAARYPPTPNPFEYCEVPASSGRHAESLTSREVEVLTMLGAAAVTHEIGDSLCISDATVRNHIHNIFEKLDVHSRLEAVCVAHRMDLL